MHAEYLTSKRLKNSGIRQAGITRFT